MLATADKVEVLKRHVAASALEDYLDLSWLASDVEAALEIRDSDELRETTVRIARELMEDDLLAPGFPDEKGDFHAWPPGAALAAKGIDARWRLLGRAPHLGEIVWFAATDRAREYAEDYPLDYERLRSRPD